MPKCQYLEKQQLKLFIVILAIKLNKAVSAKLLNIHVNSLICLRDYEERILYFIFDEMLIALARSRLAAATKVVCHMVDSYSRDALVIIRRRAFACTPTTEK